MYRANQLPATVLSASPCNLQMVHLAANNMTFQSFSLKLFSHYLQTVNWQHINFPIFNFYAHCKYLITSHCTLTLVCPILSVMQFSTKGNPNMVRELINTGSIPLLFFPQVFYGAKNYLCQLLGSVTCCKERHWTS